jgi:uncharacterized protein YjbI with pentapeptide repeats
VANEEQLAILKQGPKAWNEWWAKGAGAEIDLSDANLAGADLHGANLAGAALARADLTGARLTGANLARANLHRAELTRAALTDARLTDANLDGAHLDGAHVTGANLVRANLHHADLTRAALTGANLNGANLARADLTGARLTGARLTNARLTGTNLTNARLSGADLAGADLYETVLAGLDLSQTIGLEACHHLGPSGIDHRTLLRSQSLPLSFLRGCGLPDRLIDYLPSLLNAASIQFYSCFISYATSNQDFAGRLHADLQKNGVRCWFAPHDMRGGKKIHEQIDEAIRVYDRLLLILSPDSMSSEWVATEIAHAREKEATHKRVLFPISIVPFEAVRSWKLFDADRGKDSAREVREYFIPDFSNWKDHDAYAKAFDGLLKALKNAD